MKIFVLFCIRVSVTSPEIFEIWHLYHLRKPNPSWANKLKHYFCSLRKLQMSSFSIRIVKEFCWNLQEVTILLQSSCDECLYWSMQRYGPLIRPSQKSKRNYHVFPKNHSNCHLLVRIVAIVHVNQKAWMVLWIVCHYVTITTDCAVCIYHSLDIYLTNPMSIDQL